MEKETLACRKYTKNNNPKVVRNKSCNQIVRHEIV